MTETLDIAIVYQPNQSASGNSLPNCEVSIEQSTAQRLTGIKMNLLNFTGAQSMVYRVI